MGPFERRDEAVFYPACLASPARARCVYNATVSVAGARVVAWQQIRHVIARNACLTRVLWRRAFTWHTYGEVEGGRSTASGGGSAHVSGDAGC